MLFHIRNLGGGASWSEDRRNSNPSSRRYDIIIIRSSRVKQTVYQYFEIIPGVFYGIPYGIGKTAWCAHRLLSYCNLYSWLQTSKQLYQVVFLASSNWVGNLLLITTFKTLLQLVSFISWIWFQIFKLVLVQWWWMREITELITSNSGFHR